MKYKKNSFSKNYHYRAKFTKDVLNGFKNIEKLSFDIFKKLNNKNILDVGCNDGSLLNLFKKHKANTIGVEPANAAIDAKKWSQNISKF